MKRRGLTLVEIAVVLAILVLLAALSLPVLSSARLQGQKSETVATLRQFGAALALYRGDHESDPTGWDAEALGLPPSDSAAAFRLFERFQQKHKGPGGRVHRIWYPKTGREGDLTSLKAWEAYVKRCGSSSVILGDFTFNDHDPLQRPMRLKTGIGLQLDGSVITRTGVGNVVDPGWWECRP